MFGLNDSNSQTQSTASPSPASPSPSASAPANPFSGNDNPVIEPSASASQPLESTSVPSAPMMPSAAKMPAAMGDEPAAAIQTNDLLDLKQQALQNLQPLVSHLEQSPEEKFKTTMMLIQATDNSSLVQQAYQAANQITDEKVRAQALLDVVNEINYFTHQANGTENKA